MRIRETRRSNEIDPSRRGKTLFEGCTLVALRIENPYLGGDPEPSYQLFLEVKNRRMTCDEYICKGGRDSHLRKFVERRHVQASLTHEQYSVLGPRNGFLRRAVEDGRVQVIV